MTLLYNVAVKYICINKTSKPILPSMEPVGDISYNGLRSLHFIIL